MDASIERAAQIAESLNARHVSEGQWMAKCPCHDDKKPSLSITDRDGKTLLYCHAGCTQEAVIEYLRGVGLWAPENRRAVESRRNNEANRHAEIVMAIGEADIASGRSKKWLAEDQKVYERAQQVISQTETDLHTKTTNDFGPIPHGYTCKGDGVHQIPDDGDDDGDKKSVRLTLKPVWVDALSRDGSRENWGRHVYWQDHDNEYHQRAIKAGRMHSKGNELAQELANAGLPIVPGRELALLRYLAAFHPENRLIAAASTGWTGEKFVLPQRVFGESEGERIVFQPETYHAAAEAIYAQGSIRDWKQEIAIPAETNPQQRFILSLSLAAPLRYYTKVESGGAHLYGTTTIGKTAGMQLAASAWGNAADPAQAGGDNVYIRRWNMTRHAMEGIAEAHNDLPLIIDEIGEGDGEEFGKLIYKVMSGTGRERADRTGGARKHRHWRAWILSAGEVRVSTYIEEGGGKVRGGQLVRLIDIPADSIFPNAAAADRMKDACANYFGTAGPAFVEAIIRDGIDTVRGNLKQLDAIAERIGEVKTNEEGRIRKRFALVAIAGEMAIKMEILPWSQGAALSACKYVYELWRGDNMIISDAERGIANVRAFILKHGPSRFDHGDSRVIVRDRAGWYRDGCYCFTKGAFVEACNGVLANTVKNALSRADLLHLNEPDRLVSKIRVGGGYARVVSVREAILDEAVPNVPIPEEQVGTPKYPINKGSVPVVPVVPTEKHQMQMKM